MAIIHRIIRAIRDSIAVGDTIESKVAISIRAVTKYRGHFAAINLSRIDIGDYTIDILNKRRILV